MNANALGAVTLCVVVFFHLFSFDDSVADEFIPRSPDDELWFVEPDDSIELHGEWDSEDETPIDDEEWNQSPGGGAWFEEEE